jgi:hypothetical protein
VTQLLSAARLQHLLKRTLTSLIVYHHKRTVALSVLIVTCGFIPSPAVAKGSLRTRLLVWRNFVPHESFTYATKQPSEGAPLTAWIEYKIRSPLILIHDLDNQSESLRHHLYSHRCGPTIFPIDIDTFCLKSLNFQCLKSVILDEIFVYVPCTFLQGIKGF